MKYEINARGTFSTAFAVLIKSCATLVRAGPRTINNNVDRDCYYFRYFQLILNSYSFKVARKRTAYILDS